MNPRIGMIGLAVVVGVSLPWGCASSPERAVRTDDQLQAYNRKCSEGASEQFQHAVQRLVTRIAQRPRAASGEDPPIDLLALSGGGDYGAFGAGFLAGWGQVADPEWKRPDFDAVSGVSTGALLAPFAFVGTDEACHSVEEFYRNPKKDWLRDRGLLFFLPSNPSFATIPGLERDIRAALDEKFVGQIAQRSKEGRLLLVSATDLDLGTQNVWDVSSAAEAAAVSGDRDRVQRMLLASAAIPAVFPPIEVDDGLFADGGVTANLLVKLNARDPNGLLAQWKARYPDRPLPRVRYWVIFNNQKRQPPKTVQVKWPNIVAPSLATATRHATLAEIRWLAAEADYTNAVHSTRIEVRVVSIPDEWRPPVEGSFKQETMVSLADIGRKLGADPNSWQVWTTTDAAAPGRRGVFEAK